MRIYVGGLPQKPEPPLNYQIVYSLEGVLDYYTTLSWVLRDGKRTQVTALSEREPVEFPAPVGELEAFHTAGGLSTMAFRYEGKIPTMEYKTLRYPGHAQIMEAIRELGLLDLEPVDVKGTKVVPRDVFVAAVGPKLTKPKGRDLVALRVIVRRARRTAQPAQRRVRARRRYDEAHGISAMMRTTGYSLSITGQMQARGQVEPAGRVHAGRVHAGGASTSRSCAKRGIEIDESRVSGESSGAVATPSQYAGPSSRPFDSPDARLLSNEVRQRRAHRVDRRLRVPAVAAVVDEREREHLAVLRRDVAAEADDRRSSCRSSRGGCPARAWRACAWRSSSDSPATGSERVERRTPTAPVRVAEQLDHRRAASRGRASRGPLPSATRDRRADRRRPSSP